MNRSGEGLNFKTTLRQHWYNFKRGSELVKLARWRELILTHSETQHVSSSHVMTARGSGVRLDQWERRLAQPCALIGREPCVTRGDRCGRVLAGIPVARRALDSLEWSPITLTASQLLTIVRNWFSVAKNNCFATAHKLSQLRRTVQNWFTSAKNNCFATVHNRTHIFTTVQNLQLQRTIASQLHKIAHKFSQVQRTA